jgi:hypothetical protein
MCLLKLGIIRYNFFSPKLIRKVALVVALLYKTQLFTPKSIGFAGPETVQNSWISPEAMKQWKETTSETRFSFLSLSFVEVSRFFHTTSLSLCAFSLVSSRKEKFFPLFSLILFLYTSLTLFAVSLALFFKVVQNLHVVTFTVCNIISMRVMFKNQVFSHRSHTEYQKEPTYRPTQHVYL